MALFFLLSGSLNEPKELLGLAHFLEHMLFMGSKKYPKENAYFKFINDHAGSANAFTADHQTTYYFDIGPTHLTDALDRLAFSFLIVNLFDMTSTKPTRRMIFEENSKISILPRVKRVQKAILILDLPSFLSSPYLKSLLFNGR